MLLSLPRSRQLTIGRLGTYLLPAGTYLYLGSALGPGGLRARLARHLRSDKRPHWHIDHLLMIARPEVIWLVESSGRVECQWARAAGKLPNAALPVPRFGASDCRCQAHLVHFPAKPDPAAFASAVSLPPGGLRIIQTDRLRWPGSTLPRARPLVLFPKE